MPSNVAPGGHYTDALRPADGSVSIRVMAFFFVRLGRNLVRLVQAY